MPIFNQSGQRGLPLGRIGVIVLIGLISIVSYIAKFERNPTTGKMQAVANTQEQEIQLGLQAAPQMAQEMGGEISAQRDPRAAEVSDLGQQLVHASKAGQSPYANNFNFHLLADDHTINAFALPGGQIFITAALYDKLANEAQLAGVLGHEVGHVIWRHASVQMAKGELGQGLVGAVAAGTGYDQTATYAASLANKMLSLKYGRQDELQADEWGLITMEQAGYDPSQMLAVMRTLKESSGGAGGPAIFSTHPDPDARIKKIQAYLEARFPSGVPSHLSDGKPLR